jgi:hypothetical protein
MVTIGTDILSLGQNKKYGVDVTDYLLDPDGTTATVSGTPTVNGVNCTVTYVSNGGGIVVIRAVAAAGLGPGSRGEAQTTITLSNGEVIPVKIELTFV